MSYDPDDFTRILMFLFLSWHRVCEKSHNFINVFWTHLVNEADIIYIQADVCNKLKQYYCSFTMYKLYYMYHLQLITANIHKQCKLITVLFYFCSNFILYNVCFVLSAKCQELYLCICKSGLIESKTDEEGWNQQTCEISPAITY